MPDDQQVDINVKGQVDLSEVELDKDVPLRIAAVRDGEILASQELKQGKRIDYEIVVPLPFPCGFRLLLGRADVPDTVFVASELAAVPIPPRRAETKRAETKSSKASAASARIALEAPLMQVDASRYRIWLGWCRRFRVRGRVVCRNWHWDGRHFRICDDPVPGATVEIFDVDCFWWFCHRDLITTAVTAPDGTFEADFWWCCPPWRPWLEPPFVIDPDLLERIRGLIEEVRPHFPIPLPDPPGDPAELRPFLDTLGTALQSGPGPRAQLSSASVAPLAETEIARLLPADDLVARRVWPWWQSRDCRPDIVFRVTQQCRDTLEVIYSESNFQTRWDIPDEVSVTLVANDKACCIPVCEDPPCGDCFKFAEVGCLSVFNIGGNDPTNAVAADLLGFAFPGSSDIAFANTMDVTGVFGDMADVDYYEIEYSPNTSPLSFSPLPLNQLGSFNRTFWGYACGTTINPQPNNAPFPPQSKTHGADTHFVYESREHFESECDPGSWGLTRFWLGNRDGVFNWITSTVTALNVQESPLLPDGLYFLRVVGWKNDGAGKVKDPKVMTRCDTTEEEHLLIRLDNRIVPNHAPSVPNHPWGSGFVHFGTRDPDCDIVSIVKNENGGGVIVNPCDVIELSNSDTLTLHFMVTVPSSDEDRHLGGYWMNAYYGESAYFDMIAAAVGGAPQADPTVAVGPTYAQALGQGQVRPWWGGGHYKLVLNGSAFPETCAYLFKIRAWKRVWSNGCQDISLYDYNDTEMSITITKV